MLFQISAKIQPFLYVNHLEPVRSRNIFFKKFEILPMSVIITPDEIYNNYVEINEDTLLNINVYNNLFQKAML